MPSIPPSDAVARAARGKARFLDVRKPEARRASGRIVPGAHLRDPFAFGHDDPLTRSREPLLVFCVHGHEVSHFATALLLVHGVDARLVEGGFEALARAGVPTAPLEAAAEAGR